MEFVAFSNFIVVSLAHLWYISFLLHNQYIMVRKHFQSIAFQMRSKTTKSYFHIYIWVVLDNRHISKVFCKYRCHLITNLVWCVCIWSRNDFWSSRGTVISWEVTLECLNIDLLGLHQTKPGLASPDSRPQQAIVMVPWLPCLLIWCFLTYLDATTFLIPGKNRIYKIWDTAMIAK